MVELGGRRSGYKSPEVVLAEARRLADEIRRKAERDAATIRRDAATWASSTRAEAAELRDLVLAELSARRALPAAGASIATRRADDPYAHIPPPPPPPPFAPAASGRGRARRGDEVAASAHDGVLRGDVIDLRAEAAARSARRAPSPGDVIEVSIESKVYDVVVLALERTFERPRSG